MTFSRQWALGLTDGQPASGSKLTQLDLNVSRSIDAVAGGIITPANPIDIRGFGGAGAAVNFEHPPTIDSQAISRIQPLVPFSAAGTAYDVANWLFDVNANFCWIQQVGTKDLLVPLTNLIDSATLHSIRLVVSGSLGVGGAYSALPTTGHRPKLGLISVDAAGVATTTSATEDSSASTGAFNAVHTITHTPAGPGIPIDQTGGPKQLYAYITGVTTGFEANKLGLIHLYADFTATKLTPGG
jgi:hypothetical protein